LLVKTRNIINNDPPEINNNPPEINNDPPDT